VVTRSQLLIIFLTLLSQSLAIRYQAVPTNLLKWTEAGTTPQQYVPDLYDSTPSIKCPVPGNSSGCDVGFAGMRCSPTRCPSPRNVTTVSLSISPNCDETPSSVPTKSLVWTTRFTGGVVRGHLPNVNCSFTGPWPHSALSCTGTGWNDQIQAYARMEWCDDQNKYASWGVAF